MIHYDPLKDRSEEFGWRKVCDEHVPTEAQQDRWSKITVVVSLLMGLPVLLIYL